MNLLEAARRLKFTPWEDSCHLTCESCGADGAGEGDPFPHEPDCPWLTLPKIIATLAAAQVVVDRAFFRDDGEYVERRPGYTDALMVLAREMKGEE